MIAMKWLGLPLTAWSLALLLVALPAVPVAAKGVDGQWRGTAKRVSGECDDYDNLKVQFTVAQGRLIGTVRLPGRAFDMLGRVSANGTASGTMRGDYTVSFSISLKGRKGTGRYYSDDCRGRITVRKS